MMPEHDGARAGTVHSVLATRLGDLTLVREGTALSGLYFPGHWPRTDRTAFGPRVDAGFADIGCQLEEYLAGDRIEFELPLSVHGTDFDRRVWDLVSRIPYGQTTTYGDLGRSLGPGTDPRDVGAAVGRNPLCIVIPCHRVVGSTGKLTGYAGGLQRKRVLLELEHAQVLRAGLAPAGGLW
jgi:methylated-DNA-[protein]-cysteine S-methyltransferase